MKVLEKVNIYRMIRIKDIANHVEDQVITKVNTNEFIELHLNKDIVIVIFVIHIMCVGYSVFETVWCIDTCHLMY